MSYPCSASVSRAAAGLSQSGEGTQAMEVEEAAEPAKASSSEPELVRMCTDAHSADRGYPYVGRVIQLGRA